MEIEDLLYISAAIMIIITFIYFLEEYLILIPSLFKIIIGYLTSLALLNLSIIMKKRSM